MLTDIGIDRIVVMVLIAGALIGVVVMSVMSMFTANAMHAKITTIETKVDVAATEARQEIRTLQYEIELFKGMLADERASAEVLALASAETRGQLKAITERIGEVKQTMVSEIAASTGHASEVTIETADAQTAELKEVIEEAAHQTVEKADAAYHEANSVNEKIEKLHEEFQELLAVVKAQQRDKVDKPGVVPVDPETLT